MNYHKIFFILVFFYTLPSFAAENISQSNAPTNLEKPALVYMTVAPKVGYFRISPSNSPSTAFNSNMSYGSEFSWGLTTERSHFQLFGDVQQISLIRPKITATNTKDISDDKMTLASGGFGWGLHPTRSQDFFGLIFCELKQSIFMFGSLTNVNVILVNRMTIPHVGLKLNFTAIRWKKLSLGAELAGVWGFSALTTEGNQVTSGLGGNGKILIAYDLFQGMGVELIPWFGYTKYNIEGVDGSKSDQIRTDVGGSLGIKVALD